MVREAQRGRTGLRGLRARLRRRGNLLDRVAVRIGRPLRRHLAHTGNTLDIAPS